MLRLGIGIICTCCSVTKVKVETVIFRSAKDCSESCRDFQAEGPGVACDSVQLQQVQMMPLPGLKVLELQYFSKAVRAQDKVGRRLRQVQYLVAR